MSFEILSGVIIDKALTLGAEYTEVRAHRIIREEIILKNGKLEAFRGTDESGLCVRVLVNGCLGFAATNILTESSVIDVVERCIRLARASSKLVKSPVKFAPSETNEVDYLVAEKIKWKNVDLSEKIEFLKSLDEEIIEKENDVKFPFRALKLEYTVEEKRFESSEGSSITSKIPRVSGEYVLTCVGNSRTIQRIGRVGASGGWEVILSRNMEGRIKDDVNALRNTVLRGRGAPKDEEMDLIVGPEVAGIIAHEAVGHPFEADRILGREAAQAGESYLRPEEIGMKIGSDEVFVSDNPVILSSFGYYLYDDEGVRARKRELIREGRVEELLHNRETAAKMGVKSNGAARASGYSAEPIVRMSNTFFEPGSYSFEELLEDVRRGVYIKSFMEWNIDDRRINQRYVGLESYLIENGEIKDPIIHPVIEVTTFELLNKLDARGRDLDFWAAICGKGDPIQGVPVWTGGPHLRFRGIKVGVRK
ncbi:TldD/PmbA family protein [Candidatus Geothermarchaeota archaeon]|nr:MAG: TldD/PmbA family protein [Candidatus Geothermarchaeota archaeon]